MAQKVQVLLMDDLDGGEADETIKFSWEGSDYEIDLSEKNAIAFREAVGPYLDAARKLAKSGKAFRKVATGPDPQAVRAWCKSNGIEVNTRGRIPAEIIEQFEKRDTKTATRSPQSSEQSPAFSGA